MAHITFRCHNREFLFEDDSVKDFIITLWKKYKKVYGIKLFECIVLDNHAHALVMFPNQPALSDFMRTVNSQISRFVNKLLDRDSQVIRERFRSPVVRKWKYFRNVISYIWKNAQDVMGQGSDPKKYAYSSLHMRLFQPKSAAQLLDDYGAAGYSIGPSFQSFAESICNALPKTNFSPQVFENVHTVDDDAKIRENERYFCNLWKMRARPP